MSFVISVTDSLSAITKEKFGFRFLCIDGGGGGEVTFYKLSGTRHFLGQFFIRTDIFGVDF